MRLCALFPAGGRKRSSSGKKATRSRKGRKSKASTSTSEEEEEEEDITEDSEDEQEVGLIPSDLSCDINQLVEAVSYCHGD